MHMADTLVSPAVGGAMWAVTAGLTAYSARRIAKDLDERRVPLMGALGAFVFAAQMINFSIPVTGSSGHLCGGIILAALLGPHAAFLTIASVLTVQALFFADGGLLALGANVFNIGFFSCFVAYPLIYRPIVGTVPTRRRILAGAIAAGAVALQLGAFGVVVETLLSGISSLPFGTFLLLMQPIHLAIGIVEGLATAAVISFVWKARPEVLELAERVPERVSLRGVLVGFVVAAVVTGAAVSWFASTHPDGLEWAIFRTSGKEELEAPDNGVHAALSRVQEKTAILPDYEFGTTEAAGPGAERWPAVSAGKSVSGLVGGAFTLVLVGAIGLLLQRRQRRA